ncbi:hypothetical protein GCM10011507_01010 [Edaphobacter acidisoli]|uniref:Uncharacterized protein n=1 Tax=Edaphobacter acidisoli TaxID=2040573 RepID=A0A916REY7_9BACT|nr:hypothetical protein GCM10011507_01010 [Edaphobacter acidisoli]
MCDGQLILKPLEFIRSFGNLKALFEAIGREQARYVETFDSQNICRQC